MENRLRSLQTQHQMLDREIEIEQSRPIPDSHFIQTRKKEKLQLKDHIEAIKRRRFVSRARRKRRFRTHYAA